MKKLATVILVAAMAFPAFAQDSDSQAPSKPKRPETKPAPQPAEMDASMEAWIKTGTPNENHKLLNSFVGTWNAKCTFWMGGPDAPASETTGTMVNRWVLDGRFIRMDYTGDFMGTPFTGLGYFGHDNIENKFVSTWMDSMSTNIMSSSGTYNAAKKTWTLTGTLKDPATGQKYATRDVVTVIDSNTHKTEMYHTGADGKEQKKGEIVYTRKAAPGGDTTKPQDR